MYISNYYWPRPGTIVSVWRGFYWHYAIVSAYWHVDAPMVISFEPVGLRMMSWIEFTAGQDWRDHGYPSDLPETEVLSRALSFVARQYRLVKQNCEHHVRFAHGLEPASPQINTALAAAAVAALAVLASR